MTTRLYTDFANGLWDPSQNVWGDIPASGGPNIHLLAVNAGLYVFDEDADVVLADIPAGARLADYVIGFLTVAARGITFDPVDFGVIDAGLDIDAVVLYAEGTGEADAPLMLYSDDSDDLPATPDGVNSVIYTPGPGGIAVL